MAELFIPANPGPLKIPAIEYSLFASYSNPIEKYWPKKVSRSKEKKIKENIQEIPKILDRAATTKKPFKPALIDDSGLNEEDVMAIINTNIKIIFIKKLVAKYEIETSSLIKKNT